MTTPSVEQFTLALRSLRKPAGRQLDFLRAHEQAPGRATTVTRLAVAARYRSYRAINLHYGKLARRIGNALGQPNAPLSLLAAVAEPESISNREWVLIMHPQFAAALKNEGWI
jgi:hypothetical protein